MSIHGLHMSYLAFFLSLLLLPPPISKAKSLPHRLGKAFGSSQQGQVQQMRQNWSQGQGQAAEDCLGVFDLYIILDKSGSVGINWIHVYSFAEDLVKKFQNPKMRISIITFSTEAEVIIPLTSNRVEIQKGLLTLLEEVPDGFTHMQKGIQKAIEQIKKANSEGSNVHSVIIALTDGTLMDKPFKLTVKEANKARELGATIFTVGVHMYDKIQMMNIADSPSHSFAVKKGFSALQNIVDRLAAKTCIEVSSTQPSHVCIKDAYQVKISGRGFSNAKEISEVTCRFTFSDSRIVDETPSDMSDISISCPGPRIQNAGEEVSLQVSLNNGISFIGNKQIITGTICGNTRGIAVSSSSASSSSASSSSASSSSASSSSASRSSSGSNAKSNQLQEEDTTQGKITTTPSEPPGESLIFHYKFVIIIPVLLMALLLLFCCWKLCCKKPKEQLPPPVPEPEKDPEDNLSTPPRAAPAPPIPPPSSPSPVNPTVIVVCCGCGNKGIQGRCTNFAVMNPSCTHASCSKKVCLPSNRDCLQLTKPSCSSRSGECFGIPQASCSPKICLKAGQECLPDAPTLCSKVCPQRRKCDTLDCSQSSFPTSNMLPLLPPRIRQSVESLCQTYPCRPSSK